MIIITDPVITITDDTWTARLCLFAIIAVYKIIIAAAAAANITSKKQFLSDLDWNQEEVAKEVQVKPKSMMRIGRNINLPPLFFFFFFYSDLLSYEPLSIFIAM